MNESSNQIEQQLAGLQLPAAPRELRGVVLAGVERELRAARWDRRLMRVAAVLFMTAVGLNAGLAWQSKVFSDGAPRKPPVTRSRESLVEAAIVVAKATDAETGWRIARQLAALRGHELTRDDAAAIDTAIKRASPQITTKGNRG
jgi:hypothetical protein